MPGVKGEILQKVAESVQTISNRRLEIAAAAFSHVLNRSSLVLISLQIPAASPRH